MTTQRCVANSAGKSTDVRRSVTCNETDACMRAQSEIQQRFVEPCE